MGELRTLKPRIQMEMRLAKKGHIPLRTCLVCMRKRPRAELVRLGLQQEKEHVVFDVKGQMPGRGGYVCRECSPALRFNKRVQRAFRNRAKELCLAGAL
ncbi:MAG: YlxR family protein [Syntrophobacteraceae bacterium]